MAKIKEYVVATFNSPIEEQGELQQTLMSELQGIMTQCSDFTEDKAVRFLEMLIGGIRELADGEV